MILYHTEIIYKNKMFFSPLEGFKVLAVICTNPNSTVTNVIICLFLIINMIIFFTIKLNFKPRLIPTLPQVLAEDIYRHVFILITSNIGKRGLIFFPYLLSLYIFLAITNVFGGIPYSSIVTAQLIITAGIGFSTFIGLIVLFAYYHNTNLLSSFLPSGSPEWIAPLLVLVELISFIFRPISLSVRLFANIMAGHTLVVIITAFGFKFLTPIGIHSVASLFIFMLVGLILVIETGVQFIQAYVFTLLSCNYLSNTLYLDH
jgi:ATP synthase subunit 6